MNAFIDIFRAGNLAVQGEEEARPKEKLIICSSLFDISVASCREEVPT
jgi:hypothetical protein